MAAATLSLHVPIAPASAGSLRDLVQTLCASGVSAPSGCASAAAEAVRAHLAHCPLLAEGDGAPGGGPAAHSGGGGDDDADSGSALGSPVMIAAALCAAFKAPPLVTRLLFVVGGALMLYGAGLGGYHSGVEWGVWEGPADCGGAVSVPTDAGNLIGELGKKPPACKEPALRVFGLSFAGWNVLASIALAYACLRGAVTGKS